VHELGDLCPNLVGLGFKLRSRRRSYYSPEQSKAKASYEAARFGRIPLPPLTLSKQNERRAWN
jgi:hypothetical protein